MPKALIIGIASVDGSYLAEFLLSKNYSVVGTIRSAGDDLSNISHLKSQVSIIPADLLDYSSLVAVVKEHQPDEVYNLAALSVPHESWDHASLTAQVNGFGPVQLLDAIYRYSPHSKFFQATSREIFGQVNSETASESTPVHPTNPYGAAKVYAHFMVDIYRSTYNLYAVSGILFNHESPRRPLSFVTRKITAAAACIKNGVKNPDVLNSEGKLELWDLGSARDRGYAPEFVEAMWLTLQQPQAQDYVVATGEVHTNKDICEAAFAAVGLNWQDHVIVKDSSVPLSSDSVKGDYSKLEKATGWKPRTSFKEIIETMVQSDLTIFKP